MNNNNIRRQDNIKTKLLNALIRELCSSNDLSAKQLDKRNTNISYLISELIPKYHVEINYHNLANRICENILNNNLCPVDAINSFVWPKLSNLHKVPIIYVVNGNIRERDIKDNYITSFRRNLMTNIRICVAQQQINQIKNYASHIDKQNKTYRINLNKLYKQIERKINKLSSKIYTSLITILGIFVAIMAAVFGSLQLFGSVFRNVDKLSHNGLGKAIILGSIIIFGTYLILVLLFKGISRLTKRYNYRLPISFTIYFISSLIILFLLGTIIAYPKICDIIEDHFQCMSIIIGIIVVIIFINILIMGYEIQAFKRIEKNFLRFKDHRQKRKYIKEYKPFDYFKPFKY